METEKIQLRVTGIGRPTQDSVQLFLASADGKPLPYAAGQFLTFLFPDLGPAEIRRSYSLSSTPGVDEELSVCVKRTVNGAASTYLTRHMKVGDTLSALPAAGQFQLPETDGQPRDLLMVGGGSGITPLFSLLKRALSYNPADRVVLVLANRSEDHVIFREELMEWQRRYPQRLRLIHWLSAPNGRKSLGQKEGLNTLVKPGRLSNIAFEELAKQELKQPLERCHAFLCGPQGLMLKAGMTLRFMGLPEQQLHQEDFVIYAPFRPEPSQLPDSQAILEQDGRAQSFLVSAGQSLLEGALAAGIELPYSCRSGSCTTCSAQLLEGKVDMYTSSSRVDSDATKGHVFTCVAYPLTEQVRFRLL